MQSRLRIEILPQPNDTTCGPTALHAVYRYYGDEIPLDQVIRETPSLEEGGTLAVQLACHALRRGYHARIYTFNLQVFDPTWFRADAPPVEVRLREQKRLKEIPKLRTATDHYLDFLQSGGSLRMEDLTTALIRRYLERGVPILTGLSATYLYQEARERYAPEAPPGTPRWRHDDVAGNPAGHFVVLCGYDQIDREVLIADPLATNPLSPREQQYSLDVDRVKTAILLGIMTYDANLLILTPARNPKGPHGGDPDRRQ